MTDYNGRATESKGISTGNIKESTDEDTTNTDSESIWKTPSKLKEEVQTIIDIMGPTLSPKFSYNTSSEADNEESVFSNSKFSMIKYKPQCDCYAEKCDGPCKEEVNNMPIAADNNTSSICSTIITEAKDSFPCDQNFSNPQYICPPPLLPTTVRIKSDCRCPQVANILNRTDKIESKTCGAKKENGVVDWLKTIVSSTRPDKNCDCQYYKMNVKKKRGDDKSPPRRVVFELVEGVPKYEDQNNCSNVRVAQKICCSTKDKKNIDNERMIDLHTQQNIQSPSDRHAEICNIDCPTRFSKPIDKTTYCDSNGKTKVDVYYFDHGSFNYYRTTDAPPIVALENLAIKTENVATRFWAEIFGTINIGMAFVTSFILQFFRFLLNSLIRPLTIGLIQLIADYFFKPMLATFFNGVLQPILIFIYNTAASLRDLCDPIAEGIGYFIRELSVLIRSFRIVEVTKGNLKCHEKQKYEIEKVKGTVC